MPIHEHEHRLSREWSLLPTLPVLGAACGVLLGVTTNAINGKVSPLYFRKVMRWHGAGHEVWLAAVGQGAIEGAILGFGFAMVFGVLVIATTGLRCVMQAVARSFCLAIATVLVCWTAGGAIGLVTAIWQPWIIWTTGLQPSSRLEEIAVGWVGGSVYGAYAGTALAVVVAAVANWRCARAFNSAPAFQVLPADSSARTGDKPPVHV